MELELNKRLLKIKEKASSEKAKYSYILTLTNLFVHQLSFLEEICRELGITTEALVQLLESPESVDLSFLDQLLELAYNKKKSHESLNTDSESKKNLM